MDMRNRRRQFEEFGLVGVALFHDEKLEERHHHLVHFLGIGEVVDAVKGRRGLNGGVHILKAGLQSRVVGGERDQRGQVAARRAAGDRDEVGIAAVVGDILAHPRQRALDVDDVRRPRFARALAVVDRDADPAEFGHPAHQRIALRSPTVDGPRTARDLQQHRRPVANLDVPMAPDVQQVVAGVRAVRDV